MIRHSTREAEVMARLFALVLGALGIGAASALGTSTPPVLLTSKNLGDQPHRLTIGATADEDGVRFRVRVASKDPKAPAPEVDGGYLTVYDGDRLVCACLTGTVRDEAAVTFDLTVAPAYLAKSRFRFGVATATPAERKTMPAGAGWVTYQFTLKDFAPAGTGKVDLQVRAFVAYLGLNGVKLVPDSGPEVWRVGSRWRIVEPRHAGLELSVGLLAFPPLVSREWMLAAHGIPTDPEVNAPARLAMSRSISLGAQDWEKPAEVIALERKLVGLFRRYRPPADVAAADAGAAEDLGALLAFLKARGVELRPTRNESNYIQHMFTVGPDHAKELRVGLNYLPPLNAGEAEEKYRVNYPIPAMAHGNWAIFMAGGPGGNATEEYEAAWETLEAAFKEYPGPEGPGNPARPAKRAPTADDLAPHAAGVALAEVVAVTPFDARPMDGGKGVSFELKRVRGSGEFRASVAVITEPGGHPAPPGPPAPPPKFSLTPDALRKGQRYWVAFASPYEYPAYPQGVVGFWPEADPTAAEVLHAAVKADRWKWRPYYHPELGLAFGRLAEADQKRWRVRVWKAEEVLWEVALPGALWDDDPEYTPEWDFFDVRGTTSRYPSERPKSGFVLATATLRLLAAGNEYGLPTGKYLVEAAFDPETGTRRAARVYAASPPRVELVRRDYDPADQLLGEERFDWAETGGKAAGAKTERWFRKVARAFDPKTGTVTKQETFRYVEDTTKSSDEGWVKVRP
jgi:hypothetical protein